MKIVAVIQARMSSSRLPGKVLMSLSGKPVLEHIVDRLKICKNINEIVVASSTHKSDNEIEKFCLKKEILIYRGSLDDVLDRFYQAAKIHNADAILRITADCPVIDPQVVDIIVNSFKKNSVDLCGLSGNFPDGLDCTIFTFDALEIAWHKATLKSEREHVCPYIENNQDIFNVLPVELFNNLEKHRWTIDEPNDYELLTIIYDELYKTGKIFSTNDILELLSKKPHLSLINDKITRNEGYLNSLDQD